MFAQMTAAFLSKSLMWLGWFLFALMAIMTAVYNPAAHAKVNTFARPFDVFAAGMFLIPIIICGALRFWISRLRKVWRTQVPYFVGLLFAFCAGQYGIYLLPEFLIVFQTLSAALFLLYLPVFVEFPATVPPPLPGGK